MPIENRFLVGSLRLRFYRQMSRHRCSRVRSEIANVHRTVTRHPRGAGWEYLRILPFGKRELQVMSDVRWMPAETIPGSKTAAPLVGVR